MSYTYRRTWPDQSEDFLLCCYHIPCGRAYKTKTAKGVEWFWAVTGIELYGKVSRTVVQKGFAASFEDAGEKFKVAIQAMIAAGNLRLRGPED